MLASLIRFNIVIRTVLNKCCAMQYGSDMKYSNNISGFDGNSYMSCFVVAFKQKIYVFLEIRANYFTGWWSVVIFVIFISFWRSSPLMKFFQFLLSILSIFLIFSFINFCGVLFCVHNFLRSIYGVCGTALNFKKFINPPNWFHKIMLQWSHQRLTRSPKNKTLQLLFPLCFEMN